MTQVTLPFTFTPDTDANADEVMADLNSMLAVVNGSLEMGVNVRAGSPAAISSITAEGSSLLGARADHTHTVQGMEKLSAEPTSGNFVGREYFNTVTLQKRVCIALGSPDSWVTTGNLTAADLPAHSSRHASGGADPLPANSVDQSMLKARTIYLGVPSADVTMTANTWTDIVTGLAVTVTGTQMAELIVNVCYVNNSGSNSPVVAFRVIDGSSNILFQTGSHQMSTSGANNDQQPLNAVYPVTLAASPTLKLQMNATAVGPVVRKSQTTNASTFAVTSLAVVVG